MANLSQKKRSVTLGNEFFVKHLCFWIVVKGQNGLGQVADGNVAEDQTLEEVALHVLRGMDSTGLRLCNLVSFFSLSVRNS